MKKIIAMFMVAVLALAAFTGCGLFSNGNDEDTDTPKAATVKITDAVTHEDPADLEYVSRVDLTTGKNPPEFVEGFKADYGVDFVEQFAIIYVGEEDKVIGEYDYFVFATEEDAKKFDDTFKSTERGGTIDGNVVAEFMDEAAVNSIININIQYNSMSKPVATEYVQLQKEANLMMEVG